MKKLTFLIMLLLSFALYGAGAGMTSAKGVWANDSAEAVITDSVCIFFAKADSSLEAMLQIPSANIYHKTVFDKDGKVTLLGNQQPVEVKVADGQLEIMGQRLLKVENIETTEPYEMQPCDAKTDVGKCLQQWRLGVQYGIQDDKPYCEVNTNRHMFIYYIVGSSMVYIRAAATRNCDSGTLFFQNIRMMKNQNTGEYTMSIMPGNFDIARNDLEIDYTKFNPDACTFSPDGGIYWSVISFAPDMIMLNGCGETYRVPRLPIDASLNEWIEYKPY